MEEIGVKPDEYEGLIGIVYRGSRTGSACELVFHEEQRLWAAKAALSALSRVAPGCASETWLDRKKSRTELGPSRCLQALHQCVVELEEKQDPKGTAEKSQMGKFIKVNGQRLFVVSEDCSIVAGEAAKSRYGEKAVADAMAFAQASR